MNQLNLYSCFIVICGLYEFQTNDFSETVEYNLVCMGNFRYKKKLRINEKYFLYKKVC